MLSSKKKLTKKHFCRDCKHYVLGYSQTTQTEPRYVCDHHEKRIYRGDYTGVKGRVYHYAANPRYCCEHFEQRQ